MSFLFEIAQTELIAMNEPFKETYHRLLFDF